MILVEFMMFLTERWLIFMYIEHFLGKENCDNVEKISSILKKRTQRGVNEFWISLTNRYPVLCVLTNQTYAYVGARI